MDDNFEQEIAAAPRKRRRRPDADAQANAKPRFDFWDYAYITRAANPMYRLVVWGMLAYAIVGSAYVLGSHPQNGLAFALISFPGWICLEFWLRSGPKGLPVFPVVVGLTIILNSLPILANNDTLLEVTNKTVVEASLTLALYFVFLCPGWLMGANFGPSKPSVWNLYADGSPFSENLGRSLGHLLLGLAAVFQLSMFTGAIFVLMPGSLIGFFQTLQQLGGITAMAGAFFGGIATAQGSRSLVFWLLFAVNFTLSIASFLLSSTYGLVFSCLLGLFFGSSRIPWRFLLVIVVTVSFLNQGKFVMRAKYWDPNGFERVTLEGLPSMFVEWGGASVDAFMNNFHADKSAPDIGEKSGESMTARLDNFENLTYVVDMLRQRNSPVLYGATYALIPPLLIPRFLWPDKPRTHAGQVMLNLHFNRQMDLDATFTTYIAWGPLPEAVGNFGCVGGPIFLGLAMGFICGWMENWSARKRLLSVAGLVGLAMMTSMANSYESVASNLVTTLFQTVIAAGMVGWALRRWLNRPSAARRPSARRPRRQIQPESSEVAS